MEVDSIHVESRFDSTQLNLSQARIRGRGWGLEPHPEIFRCELNFAINNSDLSSARRNVFWVSVGLFELYFRIKRFLVKDSYCHSVHFI